MNLQIRGTVIKVAVLLGALLWIMDGVVDYFFFMEDSLLGLTFTNIPPHELYVRLFWFGGLLVIGLFASRIINDKEDALADRLEMEKSLRQNEKKYRQMFNNTNDAIYLHGLTEEGMPDQFLEVNDVACEMLGYGKEELLSMKPLDIDAGEAVQDLPDIMESLLDEGQQTFEMWHETKDGRLIPVEISSHVFEMSGDMRVLSIARDISERKRTQQALNEEREKLRHLHDAVDQLQQLEDEESILQTAVKVSETILDFDLCAIDLIEDDYLETKAISSGLSLDQTSKYKVGEGIGGLTAERGKTIWGEDLREHPEAKPTNKDFRAFISVPIGDVGVFQVVSKEVGSFDEEDVELTEIFANHLQEEIKRIRLEGELRQQAIRDPLTDLYNRRYFNETLKKEVQEVKRYGKPLAFLMIDINRFKEINDNYSHQVGDKILKEVAELLKENLRDADTVVRYGGDEFLVMMPETECGAEKVVDRLQDALDQWNERKSLVGFPLALAMGVSHWNPEQERSVEEALKEADEKMFQDKER